MSPVIRQGLREAVVFTGLILVAYAAIYLAGGKNLNWHLIPAFVVGVALRTVWRMYRYGRGVGAKESDAIGTV